MRKVISTILAVLPAIALVLAFAGQAQADPVTQVPWGGLGAENLPCPGGAHWTLDPGFGITNATIGVDTHGWTMVQAWDANESWYIDTGPVDVTNAVVLAYTGAGDDRDQLTLANCVGEAPAPSPSPTTAPAPPGPGQPTPSPSPSPAPTVSNRHQAIVICKDWTKPHAKHLKLVRFNRDGISVYRCTKG